MAREVTLERQYDVETGGLYIGDTNNHTGAWSAITTLASTTFTTCTGNITGLVGATIPAGVTIYGRFTVIKLATGSVVVHNAQLQS